MKTIYMHVMCNYNLLSGNKCVIKMYYKSLFYPSFFFIYQGTLIFSQAEHHRLVCMHVALYFWEFQTWIETSSSFLGKSHILTWCYDQLGLIVDVGHGRYLGRAPALPDQRFRGSSFISQTIAFLFLLQFVLLNTPELGGVGPARSQENLGCL
jgi:hypothetical protein